mmetsp:Transcript_444/g.528  ORF Transcript_444/g.528 Transcript_444/m.528 type:complete len:258 (+) Transcript_444:27-800(+)
MSKAPSALPNNSQPQEALTALTEGQQKLLDEYKERLINKGIDENDDVLSKEQEYFLIAFLRGRKWRLEKAVSSLLSYRVLEEKYGPFDYEHAKDILDKGTLTMVTNARDLQDRQLLFLNLGKNPKAGTELDKGKYKIIVTMYHLNRAIKSLKTQQNGVSCIVDFKGFKYTLPNADMKEVLYACQEAVPLLFKQILIVDPPWFFNVIWAVIRKLLPTKLQKRITIVKQKNLSKYVDAENLPISLGGKLSDEVDEIPEI